MPLKADGYVIYAGQGDLSKTLFRHLDHAVIWRRPIYETTDRIRRSGASMTRRLPGRVFNHQSSR